MSLTLSVPDKKALYEAYMAYTTSGGVFVPTDEAFEMGDEAQVTLVIADPKDQFEFTGEVIWINPETAPGKAGVGVSLAGENNAPIRQKIEALIAADIKADGPTDTL